VRTIPFAYFEEINPMKITSFIAAAAFLAVTAGCSTTQGSSAVSTTSAPAALGPYSQAIRSGNMLFLSGQIPLDPATGQISGSTIDEQTKRVMDNLAAVLAANDMTMANVVSTTVFMRDLNEFAAMNKVYGTYFTSNPPARATVQAARLPKDVTVEISAIATK
jgi:2-iminobutanoate/2-iminopropanoate deaminase